MKYPSLLESMLNDLSKDDLSNLEYWLKADGGTLSEGVFLLFGKTPSQALENHDYAFEYPAEYQCYDLAARSIDAGSLKGSKTPTGYRVNFNDLFRWAIERNFGNQEFIMEFIQLRERAQKVWNNNLCKIDTLPQINGRESHSPMLTENSLRIYEKVVKAREAAIALTLDIFTMNITDKLKYKHLEIDYSMVQQKEFVKYNGRGCPSMLTIEHRCRATAKILKYFNRDIKIKNIYGHEVMQNIGFMHREPVCERTFQKWMHSENIYDRTKQKSKAIKSSLLSS